MSKYRIEINAYHRKVTVVSGEWRPGGLAMERASLLSSVGEPRKRTLDCSLFNSRTMLEAFKLHLHRVGEREKSYHAGERDAVTQFSLC